MIYIKYFGPLATALGLREEILSWDGGGNTDTLLHVLRERNERWQKSLAAEQVFKIVVNHKICHETTIIPDGAEVGILPPVTGG